MRARRFAAMVAYVPRACLPPRRQAVLAIPVVSAVLFGLITRTIGGDRGEAFAPIAEAGLFGLVLPLGALVIGDAVLGAEVRNGALPFTWLAPVPLVEIVVARWAGGVAVAATTLVPATALAALAGGAPNAALPAAAAMLLGCAAHVAVFVLIGATARRAAVWSLGYVLLVERLVGAAIAGVAALSPTWLATTFYGEVGPGAGELLRSGVPEGAAAAGRLVLVAAVALALATWRLGKLQLTGARD